MDLEPVTSSECSGATQIVNEWDTKEKRWECGTVQWGAEERSEEWARVRHDEFRAEGRCASSGVVEAGCETVVGERRKRFGTRWTVDGANLILVLRCFVLSGRYEDYWEGRGEAAGVDFATLTCAHPREPRALPSTHGYPLGLPTRTLMSHR